MDRYQTPKVDRDHTLICGVTKSGKTTLAHFAAESLAKKNHSTFWNAPEIIVYDPVGTKTAANTWPDGAIVFRHKANFLAYVHRINTPQPEIFVDEADNIFSHTQPENNWLLTKGRHFGFRIWLITQRPKMVSPSVRNQCGVAYVFRLVPDDLREVGADFGHGDIKNISLDRGEFLHLESGTATYSRENIFHILKGQSKWSITSKPQRSSS